MDTTKIGKVLRWKNGQYEGLARPQGTWNLYWCYDHRSDTNMWCDCKIKTMWKNSTLSNPIHHSMDGTSPCNCLKLKGRCLFVNFGEMESVTCTSFYEAGWLALI